MKIKMNLSRKKILETINLGKLVKTKMTGNAKFATPDPPLTQLDTDTTAAETANNAYLLAKETTKQLRIVRDQKWDALNGTLTKTGTYVGTHSVDAADVESAGFAASVPGSPPPPPGQMSNLRLSAGDRDGSLHYQFDPDQYATGYELQVSADPPTEAGYVTQGHTTIANGTLSGMPSGSRRWVRGRTLGTNSFQGPWSTPVSKIVP